MSCEEGWHPEYLSYRRTIPSHDDSRTFLNTFAHAPDSNCGLSEGAIQAAEEKDIDPSETDLRLCPDCFPEQATANDQ